MAEELTNPDVDARFERLRPAEELLREGAVDRVRSALLAGASAPVEERLRQAIARSELVLAGSRHDPGAERMRALMFAADAIVALGAEGELTTADVQAVTTGLEEVLETGPDAAAFMLYNRVVSAPQLYELPPLTAAGLQLRLLVDLRIFDEASLWRRGATGETECLIDVGSGEVSRQTRREVRAVFGGRSTLHVVGQSAYRSAPLYRFQQLVGALVGRAAVGDRAQASAFLATAARALEPILEREFLLERNQQREHALVAAAERRLNRLAFDLHDGPMQDVLALAGEIRELQRDLDPFILEGHRQLAWGRFDDALGRLTELDLGLRETAHSLETSSIASRPLGEIIHRTAEAFAARTGIDIQVDVRGDADALTGSQRIVIFRAIQEALSNVREHSAASSVGVAVRTRRSITEVSITDDGEGFEVARCLARAAQQGRLGVVGIGERVRLLGGTFDIESRPGGPTTLRFTLPRWAASGDGEPQR